MGSHVTNQILVSTHAPQFWDKMILFRNSSPCHFGSHWYTFIETEKISLGLLVLFHHVTLFVIHKLHGDAISFAAIPHSKASRAHGRFMGVWTHLPDECKYWPVSLGKSQVLTMLPPSLSLRALSTLLDPPWTIVMS